MWEEVRLSRYLMLIEIFPVLPDHVELQLELENVSRVLCSNQHYIIDVSIRYR